MCLTQLLPMDEVPRFGIGFKLICPSNRNFWENFEASRSIDDGKGCSGSRNGNLPGIYYEQGRMAKVRHNRKAWTDYGLTEDSVPYRAGIHIWKDPEECEEGLEKFMVCLYGHPIAHDGETIVALRIIPLVIASSGKSAILFSFLCPWA